MNNQTKTAIGSVLLSVWLPGCGDAGAGESNTLANALGGTTGDGDGVPPTNTETGDGDGVPGDTDNAPGDTDNSSDGSGLKFDTNVFPDGGTNGCGSGSNNVDFSYIWIANSDQGSLSKIDTQTLDEVGRYRVRPDGAGMPSRTSVNLSGDVAVANRTGGVTKVYARVEDCVESNASPGIQTSSGESDILAWGQEECVAWHTPMNYDSQRPLAWTQGSYIQSSCAWTDQMLWTTGTSGAGGYADVIRLDGDDGSIDAMVTIEGLSPFNDYGGYGAVVDASGNLWFNEMFVFGDYLVRVDAEDLSHELIPAAGLTGYGIAIDEAGRIWTCGNNLVSRYDPQTEQWMTAPNLLSYGGCMVDAEARLWVSGSNTAPYSIKAYDVDTLAVLYTHTMPEHLHGISVDFAGYVWGVGGVPGLGGGQRALRIDPDTGDYETVEGLTGAYTYSDMTGFALASSITG